MLLTISLSELSNCVEKYKQTEDADCLQLINGIIKRIQLPDHVVRVRLNIKASDKNRLIFHFNFQSGEQQISKHLAIITPTFGGFDVNVTGQNVDGIEDFKKYLCSIFE